MTKEILFGNLLNLPTSDFKKPLEDDNLIKGYDGSVYYRMTRHYFRLQKDSDSIEGFFLAVVGPVLQKAKFIKDMKDKLGEPLLMATDLEYPWVILFAWDVKKVTKILQN